METKIASNLFIANQILRLKKAFPEQSANFFEILLDRIEHYQYTELELTEAINRVIDTFEYKNLTVAAIVKQKADETEARKPTIVD